MRPLHLLIAGLIALFVIIAVLLLSGCGVGEKALTPLPTPPFVGLPAPPATDADPVQAPPSRLSPLVAKENRQDPKDVRPEACE